MTKALNTKFGAGMNDDSILLQTQREDARVNNLEDWMRAEYTGEIKPLLKGLAKRTTGSDKI